MCREHGSVGGEGGMQGRAEGVEKSLGLGISLKRFSRLLLLKFIGTRFVMASQIKICVWE